MKLSGYLIVSRPNACRFLLKLVPVVQGEICIPLELEIADRYFEPPKMPTVEIVMDDSALSHLRVVQEAIEGLQGGGVKFRLVEESEGE